jgi:hypothetical protein
VQPGQFGGDEEEQTPPSQTKRGKEYQEPLPQDAPDASPLIGEQTQQLADKGHYGLTSAFKLQVCRPTLEYSALDSSGEHREVDVC